MTIDNQHWERISAYLSGDLSEADKKAFESWLQSSDSNRFLLEEARKVWENSGLKLQLSDPATEEELLKLQSRIGAERHEEKNKVVSLFTGSTAWKIAASIAFIAIAVYSYISVKRSDENVIASGNEVMTLYLPDSSRVWLNTNSRILYSGNFTGKRSIALEGEGYFQVRPDTAHPFEVTTNATSTVVLGTSFNIKAEDSTTTLTVAEGKVHFVARDAKADESIVLAPREQATFRHQQKTVTKSRSHNMQFAAWRKLNNPQYENEKRNGALHLTTNYSWRKNQINQSVIEGKITNSASLAAFKNIVLSVTYSQPGGNVKTTKLVINESVRPGRTIDYRRRLLDIFTDTHTLKVNIESAEVDVNDNY
jgi:ferric-dicitrate binding protein FerR (iron transport regulator)